MPKTIIVDDETYDAIKKAAQEDERSISKMTKMLVRRALRAREYTDAEMDMMRTYVQLEQSGKLGNITQK